MADKRRYEIVLTGSGGQGLVVSGIMLGEAALLEGKNVVQTQSYGIASRGGFSKAEVIIDEDEIIFQQVRHPDVILALTEESMEMYRPLSRSGIPVFYDTTLLKSQTGINFYGYPFTKMAGELGHVGTANMIALGAISRVTGLVGTESLVSVVNRRFSGKIAEMNVKAVNIGAGLPGGPASPAVEWQKITRSELVLQEKGARADGAAGVPTVPEDPAAINKVKVNLSVCKGCGYCREVCSKNVFKFSDFFNASGYKPMTAAGAERCSGCLKCLMACPDFAITVVK